jgi:hypothetical protein
LRTTDVKDETYDIEMHPEDEVTKVPDVREIHSVRKEHLV